MGKLDSSSSFLNMTWGYDLHCFFFVCHSLLFFFSFVHWSFPNDCKHKQDGGSTMVYEFWACRKKYCTCEEYCTYLISCLFCFVLFCLLPFSGTPLILLFFETIYLLVINILQATIYYFFAHFSTFVCFNFYFDFSLWFFFIGKTWNFLLFLYWFC